MPKTIITLCLLFCLQLSINAQVADKRTQTIEGTVNGVLDFISGDIGEERDWDAFPIACNWCTIKTVGGL